MYINTEEIPLGIYNTHFFLDMRHMAPHIYIPLHYKNITASYTDYTKFAQHIVHVYCLLTCSALQYTHSAFKWSTGE